MGWTSYCASYYRNGSVDRKAECDYYFTRSFNHGMYRVLKSSMVGSVYYAAVETLKRTIKRDDGETIYEDLPESERRVWAAVFITSVNSREYSNFYYKDMDETVNPGLYDCPESILRLLTPTDNENAIIWRENCRRKRQERNRKRKDPNSLNNLKTGSMISFKSPFDSPDCGIKKGDRIKLTKRIRFNGKAYWSDGYYRWAMKLIPDSYEVEKSREIRLEFN